MHTQTCTPIPFTPTQKWKKEENIKQFKSSQYFRSQKKETSSIFLHNNHMINLLLADSGSVHFYHNTGEAETGGSVCSKPA